MTLFVKICGITDHATALSAVEAGADAVGFVFSTSPRQVSPELAASISAELPPETERMAVFRRPTIPDIDRVLQRFTPDFVQADADTLNGFEEAETLPVHRDSEATIPRGGRFLYEGPVSGSGRLVDLSRAEDVAQQGDMILAGGLRPDNVGTAISRVTPYGVDVSSGVETSPGTKGTALIRSFIEAARETAERVRA